MQKALSIWFKLLVSMKIAFFDVDETLVAKRSTKVCLKYFFQKGVIHPAFYFKALWWLVLDSFNKLNFERVFREGGIALKGKNLKDVKKLMNTCFEEKLEPFIYKKGLDLLKQKKKQNFKIVLITAQYTQITELYKKHFNADEIIATDLEIKDGKFTGKVIGPVCYGQGKVEKITQYIKGKKVKLNQCEAYSDSMSDVPLLSIVGTAFATNPDSSLEKYAKKHKWKILRFK